MGQERATSWYTMEEHDDDSALVSFLVEETISCKMYISNYKGKPVYVLRRQRNIYLQIV
jgi:hypothetical protein